jgi:hypothetical protein
VDSSGNVGIGTTSPLSLLQLAKATIPSSITRASNYLQIGGSEEGLNGYQVIGFGYNDSGRTYMPAYIGFKQTVASSGNAGDLIFGTRADGSDVVPTERMRIDSSGNLLVGATTTSQVTTPTTDGIYLSNNGVVHTSRNTASTANHHVFINSNGTVGTISTNGSSTSYNTTSDYRLKENVDYTFDATTRIKQLKPARFNFIADADTTVDGFLAHEVQDIVPEAINGTKDEMQEEEYEVTPAVLDEDGNVVTEAVMGTREVPKYQGIDQSKLVPLLVKTIQELEARITALES